MPTSLNTLSAVYLHKLVLVKTGMSQVFKYGKIL